MKYIAILFVALVFGGSLFIIQQGVREASLMPSATSTPEEAGVATTSENHMLALDQEGESFGVQVIPVRVLEDSRCPANANCVWAGRIRVETLLVSAMGTSTDVFEIGTTITTEAESVTLVEVLPQKTMADVASEDYQFIFKIDKRTDIAL